MDVQVRFIHKATKVVLLGPPALNMAGNQAEEMSRPDPEFAKVCLNDTKI